MASQINVDSMQNKNIDEHEIKKFAQQAHRWWDENGEFKTLHRINPIRMQFILDQIDLTNKTVVDVGCGGGILTEALARAGAQATGVDMAGELIETAKLHAQLSELKINYQQISADAFAEQHAGQFEVVTCMELLEHVPDPVSVIGACAKLIKAEGLIFFSTLNRTPKSFIQAIVGAEYILKLIPPHTHTYEKFIKPAELAQWARHHGLEVKCLKGMHYHPFSHVVSLNDDVAVNYLMCLQKL